MSGDLGSATENSHDAGYDVAGHHVDFDVAIIGAGPAGSGAAAGLAARGWRVLLIERDHLPRHKVCGEFLSPEAQDTLRTLGLYAALAALKPISLTHAELVSSQGSRLNTPMPAPGWGLSRFVMDAVLAEVAQERGVTLWQSSTVVDHRSDGSLTKVTVRQGKETTCVCVRALILAGGRSVSAKLLKQPVERRTDRLNVGIKAHFSDVRIPDQVEVYLFDGGYVGINAIETGMANVCLLASYAAFAKANHNPRGFFAWIARQNGAFRERMAGAHIVEETLCSVAAVDTGRPSRPWNGMASLGDSATMIPPLCGDGMAMALHSASLCLPFADAYLRGEIDRTAWEAGYSAEWHAAFDRRLRVGRVLQAMLNSRAADLLLKTGGKLPMAADYFVRATRGAPSSSSTDLFSAAPADG